MTRLAAFGYGSLVDPRSAALTLGRPVHPPQPARLEGWQRRWSIYRDNLAAEKTFAIEPGGELPPFIIGLNLEPDQVSAGKAANGALLEVTETELDRLDLREVRYDRVDVTADASKSREDPEESFDRIFAFTAKPGHYAPQPPPGAVIVAAYVRTVEAAFAALGEIHLDEFRATTAPPPGVPIVEVRLVHDEIPDGNPRDW